MNYIFDRYDRASKLNFIDKANHDTTTNGRVKSAVTGKLKVEISLIHKVVSADRDKFNTFYTANKNTLLAVTYGGEVYNVKFTSDPIHTPLNGDMWKITTKLTGLV